MLQFETNGASSSGFNKIDRYQKDFNAAQSAIVQVLKDLQKSKKAERLTFALLLQELPASDRHELEKIQARPPSGKGVLLPSIGQDEYSMFENNSGSITLDPREMRKPFELMRSEVPLPMVPMKCKNTFNSVREAVVQLAYSAHAADVESRTSLELWAQGNHQGALYRVEKFPVIAVKFGGFGKLGGKDRNVNYRLPQEPFAVMRRPGHEREDFEGYLEGEPMDFPPHDAFFVVTSHSVRYVEKSMNVSAGDGTYRYIDFKPHYNSFTYHSQLQTINLLKHSTFWHPILLNQSYHGLPDIDMTASLAIDAVEIAKADEWLLNWRPWNPEQREVIKGIHSSKGGLVVTMGIAGTGKTLLQSGLALYFAKLGFKCLICTPANSNADHSTRDLTAFAAEEAAQTTGSAPETQCKKERDGPDDDDAGTNYHNAMPKQNSATDEKKIRVHRLYPSSREYGLEKLSEEQAKHLKWDIPSAQSLLFRD